MQSLKAAPALAFFDAGKVPLWKTIRVPGVIIEPGPRSRDRHACGDRSTFGFGIAISRTPHERHPRGGPGVSPPRVISGRFSREPLFLPFMPTGAIVSIWIKRAHRGPMDSVESAELVAGLGLEGSADQGGWRQVTLLDEAAWRRACNEVGTVVVDPKARRANILLRGIELLETRERILRIGNARIRIIGATRPCERMDDALPGLRDAMRPEWRGGAYGVIVDGGTIRVGDRAEWEDVRAPRPSPLGEL